MYKIWVLFKMVWKNYFTLAQRSEREDTEKFQSARATKISMYVGLSIVFIFLFIANITQAIFLCWLQAGYLILPYSIVLISLTFIVLGIFIVPGILFGNKQQEMLSALPVSSMEILSSRLLFLYTLCGMLTLAIALPNLVVWIILGHPSLLLVVGSLAILPWVPLAPIVVTAIISIIISVISSFFRYKNLLVVIFTALIVSATLFVPMYAPKEIDITITSDAMRMLVERALIAYPLNNLLMQFTKHLQIIGLIGFAFISSMFSGIFIYIIGRYFNYFDRIFTKKGGRRKRTYAINRLKKRTQLRALIRQEYTILFQSPLTTMNLAFGAVFLVVFGIFICVYPFDSAFAAAGIADIHLISKYIPFIIAGVTSFTPFTAASISLEGDHLWIKQTTPITKKQFFLAKVLTSVLLMTGPIIFVVLASIIRFQFSVSELLLLVIMPFTYSVSLSIIGLKINDLFPKLQWSNEVEVVKQSKSVVFTMLTSIAIIFVHLTVSLFMAFSSSTVIALAVCPIILYGSYIIFKRMSANSAIQY